MSFWDTVEPAAAAAAEGVVKGELAALGISPEVAVLGWKLLVALVEGAEGVLTKDSAKEEAAAMDAADAAADELQKKVLGG